jgi:hypothetical protein
VILVVGHCSLNPRYQLEERRWQFEPRRTGSVLGSSRIGSSVGQGCDFAIDVDVSITRIDHERLDSKVVYDLLYLLGDGVRIRWLLLRPDRSLTKVSC